MFNRYPSISELAKITNILMDLEREIHCMSKVCFKIIDWKNLQGIVKTVKIVFIMMDSKINCSIGQIFDLLIDIKNH